MNEPYSVGFLKICYSSESQRFDYDVIPFATSITKSYFTAITLMLHLSVTLVVHWKCINLLKPTSHVMHHQFNVQQLYALPTLYLGFSYLSQNKQQLVSLTA